MVEVVAVVVLPQKINPCNQKSIKIWYLTHNEHLVSSNSKFFLYITKNGDMYVKNKQTGAKTVIHEFSTGGRKNAPYVLKLEKTNELTLKIEKKKLFGAYLNLIL